MTHAWRISRRTVLRGLGTAVALPLLECMTPTLARAAAGEQPAAPLRMAFLYVPNGKHMPDWTPKSEGTDFELPYILEPLAAHRHDLSVLSGLTQHHARANGDGPGDHARAMASFLTGQQAKKTHGADIKVGVSVDQVAAQQLGHLTKFSSLELGCEQGAQAGNCDSGYSCAYSHNISWRTEHTPQGKEINPRLVFERLFTSADTAAAEARAKREKYRRSILDFVLEDARDLEQKLGAKDRQKVDEYLTSVRELEKQLVHVEKENADAPRDLPADLAKPKGVPKNYPDHIRIMLDLLALAFAGDQTRVATFVLANEGSNRPYPFLDVREGHHDISHHGKDPKKHAKIREINRFHVTQFAYFLEKLKSLEEAGGNVLDNSMIVYGSGIADGDAHAHHDLPILLAGGGSGALKPGHHKRYRRDTPLNNLFLTLLDHMQAPVDSLGDSKGRLELPA